MKKITLGLMAIFAFSLAAIAQDINWLTMEEALELQKKEPKKIFMDVYTNWCGPCKMLDKNTFQTEDVAAYINEHYYAVKFNAEGNDEITYKDKTFSNPNYDASKEYRRNSVHEFSRFLQIKAYPTMVFFDEEGNVIAPIQGYLKPQQLELYLKVFESDKYKEMTTQEEFSEYVKAFEPEFAE
ncbi:thioredoxin family protein [Winogradskyella endarachnes]|uniref:Thioredoxin fold domain-containing protein n=1 Tax=Winogradskyella endarachnes TaxID=2681965 RepID=A0A6L6U927_9FLAO|nr:thioredoxin fold domain-containing protein [Winogradskyella endarachnes]MUU78840.1 thioredoxin fold domain-containing protein [Winogradskyella endarachnes]